ncbi:MAG: carboxypeptidase-like regulatory domain-containing protein, partial [Bacteroidota bacterium]
MKSKQPNQPHLHMRLKSLPFLLCWFIGISPLLGQSLITGKVYDLNSFETLIGVNVQLIAEGNTSSVAGTVTEVDGTFSLQAPQNGKFQLVFSHIGFKPQRKSITIRGKKPTELGKVYLRQDPAQLEEVVVTETAARATLKGDTTEFNANAYKTNPEANAEDLLEKMPGVVVQDGQVQAQGEQVRKVLVDGRPFFDNDVNAALRNLPAEIIDRIQIFDQESEQAQFTGFSTGETTKTVNIVTKPGTKTGQFGKLYGGYGSDDRYQAGGSVNIFNKEQRIALIGQFNNVNQQNFSSEDLVGVLGSGGRSGRGRGGFGRGPGGGSNAGLFGGSGSDFLVNQTDGISETQAFGINYSDQWGDKMEVTASYFFNHADNIARTELERLFAASGSESNTYLESSESRSNNTNHRLSGRFDYTINERQS